MKTGPTINKGSSKQNYATPDDFMGAFAERFGHPDWDLAADESNSKTGKCFLGEEQNSLLCNWSSLGGRNLWLNPPFKKIEDWAKKCAQTDTWTMRISMLVPASVGSDWYRDWVEPFAYVLALNPRLTFKGCKDPYPKDCVLAVYHNGLTGFKTWRWK